MPAVSSIMLGVGVAGAAVSAGSAVAGAVAKGNAADAQGRAAMAQEARANEMFQYGKEQQAKVEAAAEPTAMELVQLQKQIDVTDRTISRQEELLKAVDPALIEASQQALKLLKGEASTATQPLERARQRQRQQLENRLREQLGPGFETSSAGIEALSRFDSETADSIQGAQQQALGGITNFMTGAAKIRPDANSVASLTQIPQSTLAQFAARRTAAASGGLNVAQMGMQAAGFAGGAAKADAAKNEALASTFSDIGKIGGSMAGFGLSKGMGGMGGAAETTSALPSSSVQGGSGGFSLFSPEERKNMFG